MNKVFNINLGGIPFTIDEDAYEHLSNYLKTIHSHFRHSEGYEEITTDIEARLAELFQEKKGDRPIVTLRDVNSVIAIMGTPEDFGAEPLTEEAPKSSSGSKKWKLKTGKRLFRNTDEEVIGGVCSGIAAYFGIEDPLWVRLFFVLFAITGGFAIPLYLILWAILPKAESASDRLAMRGDPVNVSNIGKIIEEELHHVSQKVSELGDELKAEFGSKKKSGQPESEKTEGTSDAGHHFRAAASEGIYVLGTVIRAVFDTLGKIIKPVAFVIGVVLVLMLTLIWLGAVGGLFWGLPFSSFLHPASAFLTTLGVINLLIFLGIPLLMLTLTIMRIFMRTHFKPRWAAGLWVFWVVNLVSLMFVAMSTVREFSAGGDMSLGATSGFTNADTLFISMEENPYKDVVMNLGNEVYFTDDRLILKNIDLNIEKSKTGKFEIVHNNFSRGNTVEEGQRLAAGIDYQYKTEGNKLILPSCFTLAKGIKWRGQKVNLTLKVPEGKWVKVDENVHRVLSNIETDENYRFPWWQYEYAWKMSPNGMIAPDFIKEEEKNYSFENFDKIRLQGHIKLEINRGDAYSVNLRRGKDYSDEIEISQDGSQINIMTSTDPGEPILIEITMPTLAELSLLESDDVTLRDFNLDNLKISNEGEAQVKAYINVQNLEVRLIGNNELDIRGDGNYLKAFLETDAHLDAEHFNAKVADITASGDSWVKVSVSDTLRQQLDESSDLISKLKPVIISNNL